MSSSATSRCRWPFIIGEQHRNVSGLNALLNRILLGNFVCSTQYTSQVIAQFYISTMLNSLNIFQRRWPLLHVVALVQHHLLDVTFVVSCMSKHMK
ncbi:hypothetical protein DAPPUDRAFT_233348 [Daphnia pulex]|uniref:Uncharacterized protein n=1 Tax=Daphnia pulex TaxID=6669 RepID=E9FTV2_DAPPU|nr:hypothetical protein DAPPUDRAFT_233348 [Daphnia pulex]|eukprot:EFX89432.1 hypothetical protein DAPPUDRAFT_233348 [Daphnia pulex]